MAGQHPGLFIDMHHDAVIVGMWVEQRLQPLKLGAVGQRRELRGGEDVGLGVGLCELACDVTRDRALQPFLRCGAGKTPRMAQGVDMAGIGDRHVEPRVVLAAQHPAVEHTEARKFVALGVEQGLERFRAAMGQADVKDDAHQTVSPSGWFSLTLALPHHGSSMPRKSAILPCASGSATS